ncbi:cytochrome P450 [Myxococcus sp. QH3KD-4-1]|nr:cytochrome P450 [Myxococcus qinghaiensis]MCP3162005.1 cytochrome P450 [Myxococcus qinghaiensis]
MLARLEARVAMEELIAQVDRVEVLTERIDWLPSLVARGPQTLPVELFPV